MKRFIDFLEGLSKIDDLLYKLAERRGISKPVAEKAIEEIKSEPRGRSLIEKIMDVIRDIKDIIYGVKPLTDLITGGGGKEGEVPPPGGYSGGGEKREGALMPRGEELLRPPEGSKPEAKEEVKPQTEKTGERSGEIELPKPW